MSIIHLLTDQVSNKIAAGEVVERPASVVKELLENALDAHAKNIRVRIEKGGQKLISVTDDGDGMDPDDAVLCFEPHATSKITSEDDIRSIRSYGFRGEAMPSIASVSRMTVRTRRKEAKEGFSVSVNGGTMSEAVPAGCAPGTETTVRDLFYNVPARRKFLKSLSTEEHHIVDCVSVISLARPDVGFDLEMDGRKVLRASGGSGLMPRVTDVFGKETAEAMVPLQYEENGIVIEGCIVRRDSVSRPTRKDQRTFVNGRCIESAAVCRGIRAGCGPMLEKGRYYPCVLFIRMNPEAVDVNVHPAKREVRFRNEFEVVSAVQNAVAKAMRQGAEEISPFLKPETLPQTPAFDAAAFLEKAEAKGLALPEEEPPQAEKKVLPEKETENRTDSRMLEHLLLSSKVDYRPLGAGTGMEETASLFPLPELPGEEVVPQTPSAPEPVSSTFPKISEVRILGVLADTYIIAANGDALLLIDQHAAHERILYERILNGVDGSLSQKLLLPITLELSRADVQFLNRSSEEFRKLGFEVDPFSGSAVKISAIPAALPQENCGGMFREILGNLADGGYCSGRIDSSIIARAACKAAVKANDVLNETECLALLEQMSHCRLPYCCPHGRPTIIQLSRREIERKFGRIR